MARSRRMRPASRSPRRSRPPGTLPKSASWGPTSSGFITSRPSGFSTWPPSTSSRCSSTFPGTSISVSWTRPPSGRRRAKRCAGPCSPARAIRRCSPSASPTRSRRTSCAGAARRRSPTSLMTWSRRPSGRTRSACAPSPIIRPPSSCARRAWTSSASTSICTSGSRSRITWRACRCWPTASRCCWANAASTRCAKGEARQARCWSGRSKAPFAAGWPARSCSPSPTTGGAAGGRSRTGRWG